MATLAYQHPGPTGTVITFVAAGASGDKVKPNDRGGLVFRNDSVAPITVTLDTPGTNKYGSNIPQITKSVGVDELVFFGPLPKDLKGASDDLCAFTYSAFADLVVAAVAL